MRTFGRNIECKPEALSARQKTRRDLLTFAALSVILSPGLSRASEMSIEIVAAPSNLGLRPLAPGHEPGSWKAPAALLAAGLTQRLGAVQVHALARPAYHFDAQDGTRVRNGREIHRFSQTLADAVAPILARGNFPLVLGGDCSILLGCLLGARRDGLCGLIHVDGHSDFVHPGMRAPMSGLGSAAGMDLALASGRGEALLTEWGDEFTPLVADERIVQIGEREDQDTDYAYPDIQHTRIHRINIRTALAQGIEATAREASGHLRVQHLQRIWLHVDVDVLDQKVMPAVDSPGSPGLNFDQLATLIKRLRASGGIIGADISVFDPELDPEGRYARGLVHTLVDGFAPL
jgi:arginase